MPELGGAVGAGKPRRLTSGVFALFQPLPDAVGFRLLLRGQGGVDLRAGFRTDAEQLALELSALSRQALDLRHVVDFDRGVEGLPVRLQLFGQWLGVLPCLLPDGPGLFLLGGRELEGARETALLGLLHRPLGGRGLRERHPGCQCGYRRESCNGEFHIHFDKHRGAGRVARAYEVLQAGVGRPWYISDVHILLVDDDAELCGLLSEFLRREGFTVDCEHEGAAGLERAAKPGPDLVVLDVMLPGLDGFEILRRLRQQSKVPVIMLTARGEDVDRIVGLELGADDYLPKPFNPRELVARIRAILRRYEPRAAAARVGGR